MKNLYFLTMLLAVFVFSATGCKKEESPEPEGKSLVLEGKWRFESMNFLDDTVKWNPQVVYSYSNFIGYAPAMFADVMQFEFLSDKIASKGNKFHFINKGDHNQGGSSDYWYWNYKDEKTGFEIQQINLSMPPYDFSVMQIHAVQVSKNGNKIYFKAEVNTRIPGQPFSQMVKTPVEITLVKDTKNEDVVIRIAGEQFIAPTTENMLKNIHWKLNPGSDVYDPDMSGASDSTRDYMKIVALQLGDSSILNYRYSYPMGIVSAKQYTQDELDKNILKVKMGGSYGSSIHIVKWQIESLNLADGTLTLKDIESQQIRTFVKIADINSEISKDDYHLITE